MSDDDTAKSKNTMIRLSPEEDRMVMELVKSKRFTTKSDVLKTALREFLYREVYFEKFHNSLINDMQNQETREELRKILSELLRNIKV